MKPFPCFAASLAVAAALLTAAPRAAIFAQDAGPTDQPFAVIAVSNLDGTTDKLSKLLTEAGAEDEAAVVKTAHKTMLKGVDGTRPWGVLVSSSEAGFPEMLMFAPIASIDEFLTSPALQMGPPIETEKLESGVIRLGTPQPAFAKEQNGWTFVGQSEAALATLPDDPVSLLGGLEKEYDVAVRLYVQRVPESLRVMMKGQLQGGGGPPAVEGGGVDPFGAALQGDDPFGGDDAFGGEGPDGLGGGDPFGMANMFSQMAASALDAIFTNIDEFTYGTKIDATQGAEKMTTELTVTVVPESPAAPRLAALEGVTSEVSGLLMPGSMFAIHAAIPLVPEDADALATAVEGWIASAQPPDPSTIEDPAEREKAVQQQELAKLGERLIVTTIRGGKLESGFALFAKPGDSTGVVGGHAGDAEALRQVMIDGVRQAQKEGDLPADEFQRIDYKGYKFVVINGVKTEELFKEDETAEAPGEADFPGAGAAKEGLSAEDMFGKEVQVVLALNEGNYFIAAGTHAVDQLKMVIDASQEGAASAVAPATLSFGIDSFKAFADAAEFDAGDMPPELFEQFKALSGPDRMLFQVTPAGRGATLRIELERQAALAYALFAVQSIKEGPPGFGGGGELQEAPAFDDGF